MGNGCQRPVRREGTREREKTDEMVGHGCSSIVPNDQRDIVFNRDSWLEALRSQRGKSARASAPRTEARGLRSGYEESIISKIIKELMIEMGSHSR